MVLFCLNNGFTPARHTRWDKLCVIVIGLLLVSLQTHAQSQEEDDRQFTIDNAHKGATAMLNDFASQIDNYFAEEVTSDEINTTSATLRFDFADPPSGDLSFKTKLKLRLVLPRSEQRIRLLFDVDDEEDDGNTRSSVQDLSANVEDQNLALALRFVRTAHEKLKFNVDIGGRRFEQRFQSFARLRVSTGHKNPDGASFEIENDLRQYYSSGYLNQLRFDFWRNISDTSSTVFRTSTGLEWRRGADGALIKQTFGFYKEISGKSLAAFEVLAGYKTSPADDESHYEGHQFRVRYRRNAFRPWFHFEVWPGITWLTENDNNIKLTGLLRMEIGFGQF